MGKAARRERNKTIKFLSGLAQENPERFIDEWDVRLSGWLKEITSYKHGFIASNRVFQILESALQLLIDCGDDAIRLQYSDTCDILSTECVKMVAIHSHKEFYRLNQKYGFLNYDTRNINKRS